MKSEAIISQSQYFAKPLHAPIYKIIGACVVSQHKHLILMQQTEKRYRALILLEVILSALLVCAFLLRTFAM